MSHNAATEQPRSSASAKAPRQVPEGLKRRAAQVLGQLPQCRYQRLVVIVGHMRSASTALASILCSHRGISGYGESHVDYSQSVPLGRLVANQIRRRAYKPGARYLFDKILHNDCDGAAPDAFFEARCIAMARPPRATIRSILNMSGALGLHEYRTAAAAADYYEARMSHVLESFARFDPARRLAVSADGVRADPDAHLAAISALLALDPPLSNSYTVHRASQVGGGGDPLTLAKHSRIEASATTLSQERASPALDLPADRLSALDALYDAFLAHCRIPAP